MPPLDTPYITISGLPTFTQQQIDFPSGVFGIPLKAQLSSLNATFGFDTTPHRFSLEYIPDTFEDETLPQVGSGVQFFIGDEFRVQGRIVHADFYKTDKGNVVSIEVEDIRRDLRNFAIDTFGVFGAADAPTNNVIDVRYWYIKNFAETRAFGRNRIIKDLALLDSNGASYRQIYDAIKYFEIQLGTVNGLIDKLPKPEIIESQLPYDPDAFRWQFKTEPLLDAFAKILGDICFNFYWNMEKRRIDVINRKFAINIDRTKIPVANDPAPITSLKYGNDEAERSTSVRVYGAQMEGLVGIGRLKVESGAYDLFPSGVADGHNLYDLGVTVGSSTLKPKFVAGWRNAKIKYFGEDGTIKIDSPSDREMKAALKGVEYWSMEKGLENRIDKATISQDVGTTMAGVARMSPSGLGYIANRGQKNRDWVLEWYNRVRNFAQNHFGRTYVLDKTCALYNEIDEFDVVPAAWCNIENLTDEGSFKDDYKVKLKYKWLAPFWDNKANKMRGWASFRIFVGANGVSQPRWGSDGKGVPSQFTSYNEEQDYQYVPIEAKKWEKAEDKFQEEFIASKFNDEKGIMITLPNTCWKNYDDPDTQLQTKPVLNYFHNAFNSETQADIPSDPVVLGEVFEELTEVALPIKSRRRYGFKWPSIWASGTGVDFEVEVKDELAPWIFEPRGNKTSWMLMEEEARSVLASKVVSRNQVTFAEVQKLGLPIISFDNFASQDLTPDGYGIVKHGITSLNITKNMGWWQTKYNLKSHFPQFIRVKPLRDGIDEDFAFILRRALARSIIPPIAPFLSRSAFDDELKDGRAIFTKDIKNSITVPVTIDNVFDVDTNPFYTGVDDKGNVWPAAFRNLGSLNTKSLLFQERKAFCIDGFLQVGMRAIYHYEDLEDGSFTHYFAGGIHLSASRIVDLLENPRLLQGIWRANVETRSEQLLNKDGKPFTVQSFTIRNVPFLNQKAVDTTLQAGDSLFMGSNGNENNVIRPNFDVAVGNSNGVGKDTVHLINTSAPTTVGFAYVTKRPDNVTGLGGAIQTISASAGQAIADAQKIGGTTYNIRFFGVEYDQVAIGDPCITIQEREQGTGGQIRVQCFINKPLFSPYPAGGPFQS